MENYAGIYKSEELGSSYRLIQHDDKTVLFHLRKGEIQIIPIANDVFTSDNRNFKFISVVRNDKGDVTGLSVSNSGAKDNLFVKLSED